MVIATLLSVSGNLPNRTRQFLIIGEYRTTIALAPKRLAGKEAGTCNLTQIARSGFPVPGSKTLRSIFNYRDLVLGRDCIYCVEIRALPE
jgi:hypothetical protein